MIKCPFGQTMCVKNTIFCDECGAYLPENDTATTGLLVREVDRTNDLAHEPRTAPSPNSGPELLTLRLRTSPRNRDIEAPLHKIINLGRMAPALPILPEIDLTPDGFSAKGVSRCSDRISKLVDQVYAEDISSRNGVFLNGRRLASYLPLTLHDGDILQLGKLLIEVRIRDQYLH